MTRRPTGLGRVKDRRGGGLVDDQRPASHAESRVVGGGKIASGDDRDAHRLEVVDAGDAIVGARRIARRRRRIAFDDDGGRHVAVVERKATDDARRAHAGQRPNLVEQTLMEP